MSTASLLKQRLLKAKESCMRRTQSYECMRTKDEEEGDAAYSEREFYATCTMCVPCTRLRFVRATHTTPRRFEHVCTACGDRYVFKMKFPCATTPRANYEIRLARTCSSEGNSAASEKN